MIKRLVYLLIMCCLIIAGCISSQRPIAKIHQAMSGNDDNEVMRFVPMAQRLTG